MKHHEQDAKQKVAEMTEKHFQEKREKHAHESEQNEKSPESAAVDQEVAADLLKLESTISELQKSLLEAQKKMEENRDAALRFRADLENVRRQAERDISNAHKYSLEKFATALLPVLDSLDHGIAAIEKDQASDPKYGALCEGMRMSLKIFVDTLAKFNVTIIDPVGQSFDPHWHEAMTAQPDDKVAPGTVLLVAQKGYRLQDRLLRPARVVVSK